MFGCETMFSHELHWSGIVVLAICVLNLSIIQESIADSTIGQSCKCRMVFPGKVNDRRPPRCARDGETFRFRCCANTSNNLVPHESDLNGWDKQVLPMQCANIWSASKGFSPTYGNCEMKSDYESAARFCLQVQTELRALNHNAGRSIDVRVCNGLDYEHDCTNNLYGAGCGNNVRYLWSSTVKCEDEDETMERNNDNGAASLDDPAQTVTFTSATTTSTTLSSRTLTTETSATVTSATITSVTGSYTSATQTSVSDTSATQTSATDTTATVAIAESEVLRKFKLHKPSRSPTADSALPDSKSMGMGKYKSKKRKKSSKRKKNTKKTKKTSKPKKQTTVTLRPKQTKTTNTQDGANCLFCNFNSLDVGESTGESSHPNEITSNELIIIIVAAVSGMLLAIVLGVIFVKSQKPRTTPRLTERMTSYSSQASSDVLTVMDYGLNDLTDSWGNERGLGRGWETQDTNGVLK
eukprot:m.38597 g.38597  ORF g.38597 m.38597 type:complete len:468 (-) comp17962_c0_seq1:462-1865(-)